MTKDTSTLDKAKTNATPDKRRMVVWSVLIGVLIAFIIFLAFFLPYTASNGIEKFSGKEAEVAKDVLGDGTYEGPTASPIPNLWIAFRAKIKDAYKQTPEKHCGIKSANDGVTYIVEVSRISFFGIERPGYDQPICIINN